MFNVGDCNSSEADSNGTITCLVQLLNLNGNFVRIAQHCTTAIAQLQDATNNENSASSQNKPIDGKSDGESNKFRAFCWMLLKSL
jgi:hypothetical protein